jgi:leader peptidase (prepilin peptidase)/N-methyltransferase
MSSNLILLWHFGMGWQALSAIGFSTALLILALIDMRTHLLPDLLTLSLLWAGLLVNLRATFAPLGAAVVGAVTGYLSLWSIYWLFKGCTSKEGMGYGDFKLFAAIGAWLGWQTLPIVLFIAATLGALTGLIALSHGRMKPGQPLPFGPFLAIAALLALLSHGHGPFFIHRQWGA